METRPLKRYVEPGLPTRGIVDERPELLRLIPKRWRTNSAVLTALAGVAVLAGTCRAEEFVPLPGSVAAPRVMMTEDEARRIINDEAKAAGIVFAADRQSMSVMVPARPDRNGEARVQKARLKLDGTDYKHKVSYEYVSKTDKDDWQARYKGWQVGDYRAGADALKAMLEKTQPKERFGVFYDPQSYSEESNRKILQAQLQGFIQWLKGQGVI